MKKLGWYAVSAAVAAVILCGGMLLAANLYVQSRAVQLRIKQALAASLRMPVSLKKTTFSPWDGLRIDGISARQKEKRLSRDEPAFANELLARSFRVHFALLPLLQRRFEVQDVLLDRPLLSWAQDNDDRWRLPSEKVANPEKHEREKLPPVDQPAKPDKIAVNPVTSTATDTPDPGVNQIPAPTVPPEPDTPSPPVDRRTVVDKFRLRHGSMDFFNHRHGLLGRFEDVNVDGRLRGVDQATGTASFAAAILPRAGVKLARFRSGFAYDRAEGLTLENATASLADGMIQAGCHVRTGETGTPYDLQCRLDNVSIDQLIKDAGGAHGLVQGRLHGKLNASGFTDDPARNDASGEVNLTDAQIREFPLFQAIGSMLRIDDLQHLQFKTARLAYHVEGTTIGIEPLVLVSSNLQITAEGRYFVEDDRLDLHARLVIDQAISRQLPRIVEQQFTPGGDDMPGTRYIDFDINGPINKPGSNLYQKVLPNALDSLLDGLLRRSPKPGKDKKPHPAKPAPATPSGDDS